MPNINMICIGKLKERYWKEAQAEYQKRLRAFCRLNIIEKKEAALPANPSPVQIEKACEAESQGILSSSSGALIALSPDGRKMDSDAFASLVGARSNAGDITFAIGGSYGHSAALKQQADTVLSFSSMTMPHQLFRIVLLEQIYRAYMILGGRTYHK
jgi:23S rRNA (pseudouridine1915-N3)-methyltransferase